MSLTEVDHQLLDRIRELARFLSSGLTVRMVHTKVHTDFIDSMRDLGDWLWELGSDLLERADQLDDADRDARDNQSITNQGTAPILLKDPKSDADG